MATAPTLVSSEEICSTPFLIRKLSITGGDTATALAHGGPAVVPDLVIPVFAAAGAAPSAVAAYSATTSQITFDCLVEDAGAITVYVIWFAQAAGGIS